jgi:hypothetical protein
LLILGENTLGEYWKQQDRCYQQSQPSSSHVRFAKVAAR